MDNTQETILHSNYVVDASGHLNIAGVDCTELVKKYGAPLYVLDEDTVRGKCRAYVDAVKKYCPPGSMVIYASKALSFRGIYPVIAQESMGADVVSPGEIYTASIAGFPMDRVFFHGNCKTRDDIAYAISTGVGCFVADSFEELGLINELAGQAGIRQKVQLRVTPGIDPHTFDAVNTGKIDSKFGTPIATGQAMEYAARAFSLPNIEVTGFHCHIGSQIFDPQPFIDASDIMLDFMAQVRDRLGRTVPVLNLGGGFAVKYVDSDPNFTLDEYIRAIAHNVNSRCGELGLPVPALMFEPGRAIVADAGITLYTVENVKTIPEYKNYVTINGGMSDNHRYDLYKSPYTIVLANRVKDKADFLCTVVGRCFESGDMIQEDVLLPRPDTSDIVAVLVTGAYTYSMASNYNSLCKPGLVMVSGGTDRLAIRPETFEHLTACQL